MKLLMISTDRKIFEEGSAVRARQIENAKKFERVDIIIFTTKNNFQFSNINFQINDNIFVYPTNSITRWFYIIDAYKIAKNIIVNCKLKIENCTLSAQDPFETGLAGYLISRKYKLPLELQIHTDLFSKYFYKENLLNKIRIIIARFLLPKANHIRVVSNRIKDSLITRLNIKSEIIEIRPILIDVEKIKNNVIIENLHNKYPQFEKIILMASRLTKEKNIELGIDVFSEILKKDGKIGLIIVGNGPLLNSLKLMTKRLKVENNVIFIDWIDQNTLYGYYKTADLFLNTSLYEGYGMTLVEANSAKCPIVSTDVGIVKELSDMSVCPVDDKRCLINEIKKIIK